MTKKEIEALYSTLNQASYNQFLNAIKKAKTGRELSSLDLQAVLCKLVESEIETCRKLGDKGGLMTEDDKALVTKNVKTIAIYMLILLESRSYTQLSQMALLFLEYSSYLIKSSYDLTGAALKAASFKMTDTGLSWSHIENASSADMLAYKFCQNARFDEGSPLPEVTLSGKGSVSLAADRLKISSAPKWEATVACLETDGGQVTLETRNSRDEKLKLSDASNALKLDEFIKTFLQSQTAAEKQSNTPRKEVLVKGNKYAICITDYDEADDGYYDIKCKIVGDPEERVCYLEDEELVKGIFTRHLLPYNYDDDCIMDAILIDAAESPLFSIRDAYNRFAKETANNDSRANKVLEARVVRLFQGSSEDKDRVIWMTANGYGGLMKDDGTHKVGDAGCVSVRFVQTAGSDIYINLDKAEIGDNTQVVPFIEEDVLFSRFTKGYAETEEIVRAASTPKNKPSSVSTCISIGRIIARKTGTSSIKKYKSLLAGMALANITSDSGNLEYATARAEYMKSCISAAQRLIVKGNPEIAGLLEEERDIIKLLSAIDSPDMSPSHEIAFARIKEQGAVGKISRLILAHCLSQMQPDDVQLDKEQMRRRICEILGVSDQYTSSQEKGGGKYGKGELENVEFKSSYVMRNDGKGADLYYQGRGQVFEAVCGLLNKDGGTVYVGVNNFGDPITGPGYGLNGDLEWFDKNFDTVKKIKSYKLGHPVPKPKDLDSYCLFLNDERDLYFKPSLKDYITISPTEDQDAIRITVKPSLFEIAVLYTDNTWRNGTAYVRDGQETGPMSRIQQEQRLMQLRSVGKIEKYILTLTEAIDKQHKVVLKDYYSSNSNQVKDRFVVPINLAYNKENLWAYDLDRKELREFRLSRIGSIDTDIDNPSYPHAYKEETADVFRWINPKIDYHIKLKLSVAAMNNLREEYSAVKSLPETELYQISPERWILDTHLHGLGAVRRFYLGLADQIEILDTEDSEELKTYIRQFVEKNILK